ncbi:MAG: prolipoprotein diacylglyceryl transferase [Melioribacteraceae bacterium]|nr:prolipoprotein diacylglyceryl transferase [Melioribacteraceae bacterium]MCF8353795.1 prolipoprotein diacylglyceryl transferase [Melioribacteraceae bacterium]MCF8393631.1 prolipoprotein diacylglyceryl transferase [Melioribacteraceae bacterium]MCF8419441.1 prolipoprotein diacylglyceryl transferase [Melioribacteraceae bacterium]
MIYWDVSPEIFSVGFLSVRWYGLLFATSFILGFQIMTWIYRKEKKPVDDLNDLIWYMILGTVIGARLGHCLFYNPVYYLSNPLEILQIWKGGLASHGAAIGILYALYLYSKKKKDQPYLWVFDRVVITVALAGFFIRTGNLFNSEIIGIPTDLSWGFIFARIDDIPRHPAQLYEAFAYLLIFVVLITIYYKKEGRFRDGYLFGIFLVLVFAFRFVIEFVKENQVSFEEGLILNMGQILSIPLIALGIYLIVRAHKKVIELK